MQGFSGIVEFSISWFLDFEDYWFSAFFVFWTLGIIRDSGVWLLRSVDCWMLGQLVAPSSRKSLWHLWSCYRIWFTALGREKGFGGGRLPATRADEPRARSTNLLLRIYYSGLGMIYYSGFFTSLSAEGARQEGVPRLVSDSFCIIRVTWIFLSGSGHSLNGHRQKVQFLIRSVVTRQTEACQCHVNLNNHTETVHCIVTVL